MGVLGVAKWSGSLLKTLAFDYYVAASMELFWRYHWNDIHTQDVLGAIIMKTFEKLEENLMVQTLDIMKMKLIFRFQQLLLLDCEICLRTRNINIFQYNIFFIAPQNIFKHNFNFTVNYHDHDLGLDFLLDHEYL